MTEDQRADGTDDASTPSTTPEAWDASSAPGAPPLEWDGAGSWYDANARAFEDGASALDTTPLIEAFTEGFPRGARIMDAGCGTGRDLAHFLDRGFEPEGIDPSDAMCVASRRNTRGKAPVMKSSLQGVTIYEGSYRGIWMMASLLHVPHREWEGVLSKAISGLEANGRLFFTVKLGTGERIDERGRPMSYASERLVREVVAAAARRPVQVNVEIELAAASDGTPTGWVNTTVEATG